MYEELAKARMVQAEGKPRGEKSVPPNSGEQTSKHGNESATQAAKAVGVGRQIVQDAEYVHQHAPDLTEEIKAGRMTLNFPANLRECQMTVTIVKQQAKPQPLWASAVARTGSKASRFLCGEALTFGRPGMWGMFSCRFMPLMHDNLLTNFDKF